MAVKLDESLKVKEAHVLPPDPLSQAAHKIENLPNEEAAQETLAELISNEVRNDFEIGGVLAVCRDKKWYGGSDRTRRSYSLALARRSRQDFDGSHKGASMGNALASSRQRQPRTYWYRPVAGATPPR